MDALNLLDSTRSDPISVTQAKKLPAHDGEHACLSESDSDEVHGCASSHILIEDACAACTRAHSIPDSNASQFTHASEIVEEPHACTDADTSHYDAHSFDVPDLHGESGGMHALGASCCDTGERRNMILAVPAAMHGDHALAVFGRVEGDKSQGHEEALSPSVTQPFGSFSDVGPPKTVAKESTAFQGDNVPSYVGFHMPEEDLLDTVALNAPRKSHSMHMDHASSSRMLPESSSSPSPCLPSPKFTTGGQINKRRSSIDVVLFRKNPSHSNDLSMHEAGSMHAMHEPALPCSSSAAAQMQPPHAVEGSAHRGSAGSSLHSGFSSPRKRASSHLALGRHQSISLSQELFHNDMHACFRSMRRSESGHHSAWPYTAGAATIPTSTKVTVYLESTRYKSLSP